MWRQDENIGPSATMRGKEDDVAKGKNIRKETKKPKKDKK